MKLETIKERGESNSTLTKIESAIADNTFRPKGIYMNFGPIDVSSLDPSNDHST